MLIAGFSKKEIEDRAKQAWVYRHRDKADSAADVPPPESIVVTESAGGKGHRPNVRDIWSSSIIFVSIFVEAQS
jgi:hypothetical protein